LSGELREADFLAKCAYVTYCAIFSVSDSGRTKPRISAPMFELFWCDCRRLQDSGTSL
jgi:hypothetical protein